LAIPRERGDGASVATADVGQGGDLEKESTCIELLQRGARVAGLEKACHEELVALTLELETWGTLVQLDPEGTCELPRASEPRARSDMLEGGVGVREEGTTKANFEFELFERATDQCTGEVLQVVGHEENLFKMFDALGMKQIGDTHAKHVFGSEEWGIREDRLRPRVGRHSRTGDMIW
jgi:hypothetical protein